MYAWYFRDFPSRITTTGCVVFEGLTLLYVGIAPESPASRQTLYDRIRLHLQDNASGSTLRLSLGCLLSDELGIPLRRVGGPRMTFADGEKKLSKWMANNAYVIWMADPEPWEHEADLIQAVSLPLNLEHNKNHPFHPILSAKRKHAKDLAKQLPILFLT